MQLNEKQLYLLRKVAMRPGSIKAYTHSDGPVHPDHVQATLNELASMGLIHTTQNKSAAIGTRYRISEQGRAELDRIDRDKTPGVLHGPSFTRELYVPETWHIRQGGEDHKQRLSLPLGGAT